jgi:hypothetical protein
MVADVVNWQPILSWKRNLVARILDWSFTFCQQQFHNFMFLVMTSPFILQLMHHFFHGSSHLFVILFPRKGERGTDLHLNLSRLGPLMMERIDLVESLEVDRNHRNLKPNGHESDSCFKGLKIPVCRPPALRVKEGAVSSVDELASISECPPDTPPLLWEGVGIEQAAGQEILSCGGQSFSPGKPGGVKVRAEKLLRHGWRQAQAPG